MGVVSRRRVLVVRDLFVRVESGGFYINGVRDFHVGGPMNREVGEREEVEVFG